MRRKSLLVSAILLCAAVSAVRADEASKAAKVEEFFQVSHTEQMLNQTMAMMLNQAKSGMVQQMMGVKPSAEQTKSANELQDRLGVILTNALSWEKLKPLFVKLYSDAFTEEELDGIVGFYKSPAGQSMIAKMPLILSKSTEIAQQQLATAMPDIQKLMKDFGQPKQ